MCFFFYYMQISYQKRGFRLGEQAADRTHLAFVLQEWNLQSMYLQLDW